MLDFNLVLYKGFNILSLFLLYEKKENNIDQNLKKYIIHIKQNE